MLGLKSGFFREVCPCPGNTGPAVPRRPSKNPQMISKNLCFGLYVWNAELKMAKCLQYYFLSVCLINSFFLWPSYISFPVYQYILWTISHCTMSHKIELSVTKCYVKMCPCPFLPFFRSLPFYCTILLLSALQLYRISCSKVLGKNGKWVSEESRVLNDPSNRFYDVL